MTPHRVLAAFVLAAQALAQPPAPTPTPTPPPAAKPNDVPPSLALGARAEGVRRLLPVAKIVVIVADTHSYAEAIGRWRTNLRFPVLIDDGTPAGRERIGRFVRAFEPTKVIRWTAKPAADKKPMNDWVADPEACNAIVERAWTTDGKVGVKAGSTLSLLGQLKAIELNPPGVVVAAKDDPAWVAGLALAAGHGQPILWTTSSRKLDDSMAVGDALALSKSIGEFCTTNGLAWKGLGDTIDAVTIAAAVPATIAGAANGKVSTSDFVGRHDGGKDRWAWSGQIFGQPAPAAYAAMCSLFLQPKAAWLFDSYPTDGEWNNYDLTQAADHLRKSGLTAFVTDHPSGDEANWRRLVASPISADLCFVNTKGNKEFFELFTGKGLLGDVPLLTRPVAVYFVHSFSAQYLGTRDTVAGRWLDRGAYAYCGSCDEPGLSGFLPSPIVAARFASGFPWGAAVRYDNSPAWKISTLGDPLMTMGPAPKAAEAPTPADFPDAIDLSARVKDVVKTNLAEAMELLVLLGRDGDAARLLTALTKTPDKLTPETVLAAGLALARTGRGEDLLAAVTVLKPEQFDKLPELRDAVWLTATPRLKSTKDQQLLAVLRDNVRPEQIARDMTELAEAWKRVFSGQSAAAMLQQIVSQQKNPYVQAEARKAMDAIRGKL